MRERLIRFFAGRNGPDQLGMLAFALSLILFFAGRLFGPALLGIPGAALSAASMAGLVYTYWRMLSRNVYKRAEENRRYLTATGGIRRAVLAWRERFKQRKDFRFFKCPSCKAMLRVPRGKGKIQITCRRCGNRFSKKT